MHNKLNIDKIDKHYQQKYEYTSKNPGKNQITKFNENSCNNKMMIKTTNSKSSFDFSRFSKINRCKS
jgi:hypothetical protein